MIIPDNADYKELPSEILYLAMASLRNLPICVSFSYYEECVNKYPEYFPDEIEWNDNYKKVPQDVHDAYKKDLYEKFNYKGKHLSSDGGIMYLIHHQKEVDEEFKESDKLFGTYNEIWNNHYEKYGLKK
jgi:hypothetical protein